jgi:hypothetical protein
MEARCKRHALQTMSLERELHTDHSARGVGREARRWQPHRRPKMRPQDRIISGSLSKAIFFIETGIDKLPDEIWTGCLTALKTVSSLPLNNLKGRALKYFSLEAC